eukprot:CAMPEP_0202969612 /NCGR_PEP_ID=MMETSP1396-20130829/15428_1 /ASSEMBLY_ACC=CAM_ASM_000872 /TAXON_ID= /ORGANISM="Pseudokeronopsis sp., Strain Brazil" /LENGTH=228 /DNA_ID=CAMNT_0049697381 /DNA_START=33 /DNA_END=719 /DNA_ORIENTATION=-
MNLTWCHLVRSQEVWHYVAVGDSPGALRHCMEDVKRSLQVVADVEDRSYVAAAIAVVGGRPHCDQVLVFEPVLEPVHHQLMSPGYQLNIVNVVELGGNFGTEEPPGSSRRHCPGFDVFGVGPHQVAEGPFVRDLHPSFNQPHLVHRLYIWRETTMDAKDLALYNCSNAKVVKDFGAVFPRIGISVLSDSLIVEPIDSGDLPGLVVPSQEGNVSWVLQLQTKQELESFN